VGDFAPHWRPAPPGGILIRHSSQTIRPDRNGIGLHH
jgi:hypothetical protein